MIWSDVERLAWRPRERLTVSAWAEKYRSLKSQAEEKGPMRMSRTPYLVPILNLGNRIDPSPECNTKGVSFAHVDEVVICKPAQIAGTEGVISLAGYFTHQEPCTVLVCLADEDTASYIANNRIQSMYTDSEEMAPLIVKGHFNTSEMAFTNGAHILLGWASSVAKIASRPARIIIADEIDKPGYYAKSREASPLSLLRERKEAFYSGMIWMLSTPTLEGSNIDTEMAGADVVYDWHVPCPKCGEFQPLRWAPEYALEFNDGKYRDRFGKMRPLGGVVWAGGREATRKQIAEARYQCGSCKAKWSTVEKDIAVGHGMMVPRAAITYAPRKVGVHINRLYSLLGKSGSIPKLVGDWCDIHRIDDKSQRIKKKQGFINSTLACAWRVNRKARESSTLFQLCDDRPAGIVPGGGKVACLTAGVDTQDHSFFYEIRAWSWGRHLDSWQIRAGEVLTFDALEEVLWNSRYEDAQGNAYFVRLALQDAMGHRTADVYEFCRRHAGKILPTQGKDVMAQPFAWSTLEFFPGGKKPIPGGLQLIRFDSNYFKNDVSGRLGVSLGDPGAWMFNAELTNDWAAHMSAEYIGDSGKWECPPGKPNHGWDCSVLNRLAADVLQVRYWEVPGGQPEEEQPKRPEKAIKHDRRRW